VLAAGRRGPFWSAPLPPLEDIARRAPFPLYGLTADWTGGRRLHTACVSDGEVTYVGLRHGAPAREDPELVVTSFLGDERQAHLLLLHAAHHLDVDDGQQPAADVGPDEVMRHQAGRWRPWTVAVEGRDQVFWLHDAGHRWAAFARVGTVRVLVAATRWDRADVRLAIVDPAAYAVSGSTTNR